MSSSSRMSWKYSEHLLRILREREQSVGLLYLRQNDNIIFLAFNNNKSERSRWEKTPRKWGTEKKLFDVSRSIPTTRKEQKL